MMVIFNHCLQDFFFVLDASTGRGWCAADAEAPTFYQFIRGVYLTLNLLGMPTFTLISGFCSKVSALNESQISRLHSQLSARISPRVSGLPLTSHLSPPNSHLPTHFDSSTPATAALRLPHLHSSSPAPTTAAPQGYVRCAVSGDGAGLAARSRRAVETLLVPWLIWQIFYLLVGLDGSCSPRHPPHSVPVLTASSTAYCAGAHHVIHRNVSPRFFHQMPLYDAAIMMGQLTLPAVQLHERVPRAVLVAHRDHVVPEQPVHVARQRAVRRGAAPRPAAHLRRRWDSHRQTCHFAMYGAVKPPNVLEYVLPSQCGWSVAVAFACGFCL